MLTDNLFHRLMANDTIASTRALKFGFIVVVLAASISAIRTAYDRGYLTCANSPEYLSALGVLSRHGDYRLDLNELHIQMTVCLFICGFGLWARRPISLLGSLLALGWVGKIYLHWYRNTITFMAEQEIPDFSLLQGPGKQDLFPLREGTWWDLVVLVLVIALFVWLVKRLIQILSSSNSASR